MTDIEYLKKYYKGNIDDAIKLLNKNIPVQYIVGEVDFYGNIFKINNNVLIPRFETEQLVEFTIEYINDKFNRNVNILDIGTGSGCIAITLKKNIDCNVDAVDISLEAIKVAKDNAKLNNVDINIFKSDILNNVDNKYDVIISNPPYISYDEEIMDIVKNNEPKTALYASNDGLYFYEEILKKCKRNLNKDFIIAFEIGSTQGKRIKDMALNYLDNIDVYIKKDLNNLDRFVIIVSRWIWRKVK